jgi:hypothetical protein
VLPYVSLKHLKALETDKNHIAFGNKGAIGIGSFLARAPTKICCSNAMAMAVHGLMSD